MRAEGHFRKRVLETCGFNSHLLQMFYGSAPQGVEPNEIEQGGAGRSSSGAVEGMRRKL